MKILSWILHEVKLQMINGLYGVYVVANLIYIFLLGYIPEKYIDIASTLIIFSDPTMLGMIFVGAFVLLEKRSGVIKGLGITPLGSIGYILGKVFSMVIIALLSSLLVSIGYKGLNFNIFSLVSTVVISSVIFTMIGIIISAYTNSMNQYLFIIVIVMMVLSLPLINFLGLNFEVLNIIPTHNVITLIYQGITNSNIEILNLLILFMWFGIFSIITKNVVEDKLFKG